MRGRGSGGVSVDLNTFLSTKTYGVFQTMKVTDLISYLEDFPIVHFLLDIRCESEEEFEGFASELNNKFEIYSDRIALMINGNQYYEYCDLFCDKFTFIYRALNSDSYVDVIKFCQIHSIDTICFNPSYFRADIALPFFSSHGINVLIYSENDAQTAMEYISLGAIGTYSDVILPMELDIFR